MYLVRYSGTPSILVLFLVLSLAFVNSSTLFARKSMYLFPPVTYRDITYQSLQNDRHTLDIYLSDSSSEDLPTLFLIHGGGYIGGDKAMMYLAAQQFISEGYSVVVPNYRLAPAHIYPTQIEDLFCALAWVYSNSNTYGFNREKLVLVGESAGGNAAALLGTVDNSSNYLKNCPNSLPDNFQPAGIVAYYPWVDVSTCICLITKLTVAQYLGVDLEMVQNGVAIDEANPIVWIDRSDPPVLLVHGVEDRIVPYSESVYYSEQLKAAGVSTKLLLLEGAGHGLLVLPNLFGADLAFDAVAAFLAEI